MTPVPRGPDGGDRLARLRGVDAVGGPASPPGTRRADRRGRARRGLHPVAWWAWALGLAVAAARTTNPLLLALIIAVAGYVVASRRTTAPWARSFSVALRLGAVLIAFRVVLSMAFAVRLPGTELFTLPSVELPGWAAGVSLGGPVTAELLVDAAADGLRLATLVACVGAANALASPYRLLRSLPPVLYELGVSVTVALAFVPELVGQLGRLREVRRLRGRPVRGVRALRGLALPVLEGGLERAVDLAASMDARGYGRRAGVPAATRRLATGATVVGMLALGVGVYAVLDAGAPRALGLPVLAGGSALLATGLVLGGRRAVRTRYRPDRWRAPELVVAVAGVPAVVAMALAASVAPEAVSWSVPPLAWPELPLVAVVGILVGLVPAVVAPLPPLLLDPRASGARRARAGAGAEALEPVVVAA